MRYRHISVAIPTLAELENLPDLVETLKHQSFGNFTAYFCVNNPEGWDNDGDDNHRAMYLNNQVSIEYLSNIQDNNAASKSTSTKGSSHFVVIDRSSKGCGWTGKQGGVGWARKVILDTIAENSDDNELIVSLDADTSFALGYLQCVVDTMNAHPDNSALCVPYYHPLSGDEDSDRAALRYEIYMRHYLINLLEIADQTAHHYSSLNIHCHYFPYAFTALGSAMVFPLWAYRRAGGITPLQGGEDFYLMQKFAKTGSVLLSCDERVSPQGRPSLRVPFGTGPAVAKGVGFINSAYPLYPAEGFRSVSDTYALFPTLFEGDTETPMSDFLRQQLKTDDLWGPLRKNFKTRELFIHACQERVDGLRILQYLKRYPLRNAEDELRLFCNDRNIPLPDTFDFTTSPISVINRLRDALFDREMTLRHRH